MDTPVDTQRTLSYIEDNTKPLQAALHESPMQRSLLGLYLRQGEAALKALRNFDL